MKNEWNEVRTGAVSKINDAHMSTYHKIRIKGCVRMPTKYRGTVNSLLTPKNKLIFLDTLNEVQI